MTNKIMEKEFIPYAEALALKELGFDKECFGWYISKENQTLEIELVKQENLLRDAIVVPTFSQAFRWFREKYDLVSYVHPFALLENNGIWCYEITDFSDNWDESFDLHSHKEAELECLKKLIEIVKQIRLL